MIYKTRPQRPHRRTSKYGAEFPAGRGMAPQASAKQRRIPQVQVRSPSEVVTNEAAPSYMASRLKTFRISSTALNGKRSIRDLNIRVRPPNEVYQRGWCVKKGACMRGVPRRTGHCLPKTLVRRRRIFKL